MRWFNLKISFIFFLSVFFYLSLSLAEPEILNQAVGQVQNHFVTSREVKINAFLDEVLYGKSNIRGLEKNLQEDKLAVAKRVTSVLLEWVVYYESSNFNIVRIKEGEFTKAKSEAEARLAKSIYWRKLQVEPDELKDFLRRKIIAKNFIRFKVESSRLPVTAIEAKKYFDENRAQFGNLPFDKFQKNIIQFLEKQRVNQRLKDWFEILQSKYQVRNFANE